MAVSHDSIDLDELREKIMSGPIRIGVIGAGWFASRRHLPDIERNENAVLAAICRRDEVALSQLADHFQPRQTFTDWRAMLEKCELDAVLIATPHNLHYEPAKAALERGLHVLVEKPMTVRATEARELESIASDKGLTLLTAVNPPFWAHCHRIRGAIASGRIGEIEGVSFFWSGDAGFVFGRGPRPANFPGLVPPTLYRADPQLGGGGYLIDGGTHLISEILWTTQLRVTSVSCSMDTLPLDMRATLVMNLENGSTASVTSIGNSRLGERRVKNVFGGSKGTIAIEGFGFQTTIHEAGGEPESFLEADLPPVSSPVANFVDSILGIDEPYVAPGHGVHVVEVVEAAYRSAESGCSVKIG